ncbi:hypothetical protein HAHE_26450 [Haloferula helveola]|uniref:Uncharacterized protein n=1 Tax=Haloferula helveola TaxID=490095 RepID=A0ABN6H718_9BACT|nr:hypothetical protein HAHE_26450 [Haloferula helveola]
MRPTLSNLCLIGGMLLVALAVMLLNSPDRSAESGRRDLQPSSVAARSDRPSSQLPTAIPEPMSATRAAALTEAEWRIHFETYNTTAENRRSIIELSAEIRDALAAGLDPDGEDAAIYGEAMAVLLTDRPRR